MFQENALPMSAATLGGAVLFGLAEYFQQGQSTNWKRVLTYSALGATAGAVTSVGLVKAKEYTKASGEANWAIIGGSAGLALPLIYSVYEKYVQRKTLTNADLIKRSVMWMVIAGGVGTSLTYVQKKY